MVQESDFHVMYMIVEWRPYHLPNAIQQHPSACQRKIEAAEMELRQHAGLSMLELIYIQVVEAAVRMFSLNLWCL